MAKTATKRTTQTTKIAGKRVRIVTTTSASGTKVTVTDAPVLEIDLQTEAVKCIKRMPGYASTIEDVLSGKGKFTIAADQNGSGYRSRQASVKFKAAGMMAGEPDLRFYFAGGRLRTMEFKGEEGALTASQNKRFPLLRALGFQINVVEASTPREAAEKAVALVSDWLAANDN